MKKLQRIPYHLVEPSPWPITSALRALFIVLGLINIFYFNELNLLLFRIILIAISILQWWRDIIREATYIGKHTKNTQNGLRLGILLFIIREVCFFFSFFWTFFHIRLNPNIELGCSWPPIGIKIIDPFSVPLLNTTILLASGFTITWSHYRLLIQKKNKAIFSIIITIALGTYFRILQLTEYNESSFTIADRVYGSIFFTATGFHGIHVIIGTLFLFINLIRIIKSHFSKTHHLGFEIAAWYWHFVDVIWICLYTCIYWWGSL